MENYNYKPKRAKEYIVGLEYSHKYTKRFLQVINPEENYDLAISFLTPHYIVRGKVKAKKWCHCAIG